MSAFLICDVTVKDRNALQKYLRLSEKTLEPFGGKFHTQAGRVDVLEGDWEPKVVIVAEFPSMDKIREWYTSDEYSHALRVKPMAIDRNMLAVEGLSSA